MSFLKNFLFALALCVLTLSAKALVLTADSKQVNLSGSAQFLEDPTGQWSLDDVRARGHLFRAWYEKQSDLNFGFTSSAYWVRVPLQRTEAAPRNWLLELQASHISELDFYSPQGDVIHTGSDAAIASRPYFDRFFVFPLQLSSEPQYLYLRAETRHALTIPLKIWQATEFQKHQQVFQFLQFTYYGGLIVLALYGLVIYLSLRDFRFLIYCAFIAMAGLGIFAGNGYGRLLIWSNAPAFDGVSQSFFLSLAAYLGVLFTRRLLFSTGGRSLLTRLLVLSQSLFLAISASLLLGLMFPFLIQPAQQVLMVNSLVMGVLIGTASVQAFLNRQQGVRFFLMGWLILWLGITVAALRAFGWIPSNGITSYAVQISTVFEMLLMALALGDILRHENKEHEAAQQQALQANQALLDLTQASEERLKHAVTQRTSQLEASLKMEKGLREQYVRFGSMISHEFRTPLGIIQGQASLMRKEHEHGVDHVNKRIEAIASATRRLAVMFDKWLHSDAITNTLEMLEPKMLELQPWLHTLIKTSPHLLLSHSTQLRLSPDVSHVFADEYHLGIAVINLIDNAAKYSPPSTTIFIETLFKQGYIGIAVTDQGPGIPKDLQDKVFADFFRLSPESNIRGVGLGLSIVQRIAQAHGGYVDLSSSPGQGASFCIWLPSEVPKEKK
jgi:signal transduction histidine kinase